MTAERSLIEEVRSSGNSELTRVAARGLLPLPPAELVALQISLTRGPDAEVAALATDSLKALDVKIGVDVVEEGVGEEVLRGLAELRPHARILAAILRRRDVPRALLAELAPGLSSDLQEILLLRQDALVESPHILDALERNPRLTPESRRRILEYREHLVPAPPPAAPEPESAAELEARADRLTEEEVQQAIRQAATEAPEETQVEEVTGLTESQIRSLPIPVRLRLTRGAPRTLRTILVRDKNPMVALSVLRNNALSDTEIEEIAGNKTVKGEVLQMIGNQRGWVRRYPIVVALVRNPRSPASLAIRLVARLGVRDLRTVFRDRNVQHAVRAAAERSYRIKRK